MRRFPSAPAKTKLTTTNNITKTNLCFLSAKVLLFQQVRII